MTRMKGVELGRKGEGRVEEGAKGTLDCFDPIMLAS